MDRRCVARNLTLTFILISTLIAVSPVAASAAATLQVDQSSVSLTYATGTVPGYTTINVSSSDSSAISFTGAMTGDGFLLLLLPSGAAFTSGSTTTTPQLLLGLNSDFLRTHTTGTYTATITLTGVSPNTSTATVNVSLTIGAAGSLSPLTATLTQAPQTVSVGSTGLQTGYITLTSSTSNLSYTASIPSCSWLTFQNGGTSYSSSLAGTSGTIGLYANPTGLNGSYSCNVTVTPSSGAAVTVPVPFTVGTATSGNVTLSAGSLSFSYQTSTNTVSPTNPQYVVASAANATLFTVTSNKSWLNVTSVYGSGSANLPMTLVTAYATASDTATVTIAALNSSGQQIGSTTLPVYLTVNGQSASALTFNAAYGQNPNPNYQTITLSSALTAIPTAYMNNGSGWLYVTGSVGSTQATVYVYSSSLPVGTYTGYVVANSQNYTVTLTVGGSGTTGAVTPSSLSFWYQIGSSSGVPGQILYAPGSGTSTPTASASTTSGGNWLSASPNPNGIVGVYVSPSLLTVSTAQQLNGTVVVNGQSIPVTLNLTASPVVVANPATILVNYTTGMTLSPQAISLRTSDTGASVTATATASAAWLTVTTSGSNLVAQVNPAGLANGTYSGTITLTVTSPSVANSGLVIPVTLNVNTGATSGMLTFGTSSISLTGTSGGSSITQALAVNSSPSGISFTVAVPSNCSWLTVSPASSTTNATVNITANPASLAGSSTPYSCNLSFTASGQAAQTFPVSFTVTGTPVTVSPTALSFDYTIGATVPQAQTLQVTSSGGSVTANATATTTSGGNWLGVMPTSVNTPGSFTVGVNTTGLAAGTYTGTVSVNGTAVQVTLTVRATPPVSLSTTTATFSYRSGDQTPAAQQIQVSGTGQFTVAASSSGWLSVTPTSGTAPTTLSVTVAPQSLGANTYNGTITVTPTAGGSAMTVNVTLTVTAPLPTITRVVNAASYAQGSISPGEIITIFGTSLSGANSVGLSVDTTGLLANLLGDVRVLFGGVPGPLVYVSATQISAIVPYQLAGQATTTVQVEFRGSRSNGVPVTVTTTAPGVFTLNASGSGPGAILNQDNSVNSPSNPAAKGNVVVIYATGEGQTFPQGVTGKVIPATTPLEQLPKPLLRYAVTIDGQPANVLYAGAAPGLVSGVIQLNVVVPPTVSSGDVPVVVTVGNANSQQGVTVSVR